MQSKHSHSNVVILRSAYLGSLAFTIIAAKQAPKKQWKIDESIYAPSKLIFKITLTWNKWNF